MEEPMNFPKFITELPVLDIPFGPDVVEAHAIPSDNGVAVFFVFHKDAELPAHSHGAQWGTVVAGKIELTIDGASKTYGPGDSYDIPAGVVHSVKAFAGCRAIDVFEEPDRYLLRG